MRRAPNQCEPAAMGVRTQRMAGSAASRNLQQPEQRSAALAFASNRPEPVARAVNPNRSNQCSQPWDAGAVHFARGSLGDILVARAGQTGVCIPSSVAGARASRSHGG